MALKYIYIKPLAVTLLPQSVQCRKAFCLDGTLFIALCHSILRLHFKMLNLRPLSVNLSLQFLVFLCSRCIAYVHAGWQLPEGNRFRSQRYTKECKHASLQPLHGHKVLPEWLNEILCWLSHGTSESIHF